MPCAVLSEAKCRTSASQEVRAGRRHVQSRCCLHVAAMVRVHACVCICTSVYVHAHVCIGQRTNSAVIPHLVFETGLCLA